MVSTDEDLGYAHGAGNNGNAMLTRKKSALKIRTASLGATNDVGVKNKSGAKEENKKRIRWCSTRTTTKSDLHVCTEDLCTPSERRGWGARSVKESLEGNDGAETESLPLVDGSDYVPDGGGRKVRQLDDCDASRTFLKSFFSALALWPAHATATCAALAATSGVVASPEVRAALFALSILPVGAGTVFAYDALLLALSDGDDNGGGHPRNGSDGSIGIAMVESREAQEEVMLV